MKTSRTLLVVAAAFAFIGSAMATPPGKDISYAGGANGKVTMDSKLHASKGAKCNDCHPKVFQMKSGATKITMAAMNKGENCGTCHDGKKAFSSSDAASCSRCHKK